MNYYDHFEIKVYPKVLDNLSKFLQENKEAIRDAKLKNHISLDGIIRIELEIKVCEIEGVKLGDNSV